jgi:hypothetical protein
MVSTPITEWQAAREGCAREQSAGVALEPATWATEFCFRSCLVSTGRRREAGCRAASATSCALTSLDRERMRFPCRHLDPGSLRYPSASVAVTTSGRGFFPALRENFAIARYSSEYLSEKGMSWKTVVVAISLRTGGDHDVHSTRSLSNRFFG